MTTQSTPTPVEKTHRTRNGLVAGAVLILIGVFLLANNYLQGSDLGIYLLPALGALFLIWGLLVKNTGLLIPGGILVGIGTGAFLIDGPLANSAEPVRGGTFLMVFAAGWALISLLSIFTTTPRRFAYWPLIPGGIMALIGGALLSGNTGIRALEIFGQVWPVGLILVGAYLLLRRNR